MFHYPNNSNYFEPNDSNNQRSTANLDNLRAYLFCPISLLPHHTMKVYITTYIRLHIHTLEAREYMKLIKNGQTDALITKIRFMLPSLSLKLA